MKNHHRLTLELIAKNETDHGAIPLKQSVAMMKGFSQIAKKNAFDCYIKATPKSKLEYVPTGAKIHLETLEDIAQLTDAQFEFFVDDLRAWCQLTRGVMELEKIGGLSVRD